MRIIFFKIMFLIFMSEVFASENSFFIDDTESKMILNKLSNMSNKGDSKHSKNYKLSGIFFIDENNWTVWINDKPYSTIGQQKEFSIDEVLESGVYLTLPNGNTIFLSVDVE